MRLARASVALGFVVLSCGVGNGSRHNPSVPDIVYEEDFTYETGGRCGTGLTAFELQQRYLLRELPVDPRGRVNCKELELLLRENSEI